MKETAFEYIDKEPVEICSNEKRWINKIRRLKERKPDDVEIICEPENNEGFILAKFPQKWLRINPTREIHIDEAERLKLNANRVELITNLRKEGRL